MELCLAPQEDLSPLETLLTIYAPIVECLVSHLPTAAKLSLAQTSRSLRRLLHQHPLFFANLDFRLSVFESAGFDTYPPGTVYNLDALLQSLPIDGRIVSLTLDWTAVSGYFLFNKILERCKRSLEHLSVRGCRKVSIKHHIVPHFVYQTTILPLTQPKEQKPALRSLYVYKARGVRRKPFIIDRKPADGDEPSRYLTTLCESLGIWLDLGLCPTPRLRCPRRRDILRRNKEKFCVPFDKRWRIQERNESLSQVDQIARQKKEQTDGERVNCWSCDAHIPDRCEACVHQMTCSACFKSLCHQCSFLSTSHIQQSSQSAESATTGSLAFGNVENADPSADNSEPLDLDVSTVPSPLLRPCCSTAPINHADNLCGSCHATIRRESCSLCDKRICIKHELDRCRTCQGGCGRLFCFTTPDFRESGCGELETGRANMKDCLGCSKEVCGDCQLSYTDPTVSSPSPVPSEDDGSESTLSVEDENVTGGGVRLRGKTSCNCRVCQGNYYCRECWPRKPLACESRPRTILKKRGVLGNSVKLFQVDFDDSRSTKWFTHAAFENLHPEFASTLINEYETRKRMEKLMSDSDRGKNKAREDDDDSNSDSNLVLGGLEGVIDRQIEVADHEWILERVLAIKPAVGIAGGNEPLMLPGTEPYPVSAPSVGCAGTTRGDSNVLCKWLGRGMNKVTWENRSNFAENSREDELVDAFVQMCKVEQERELEREMELERGEGSWIISGIFDNGDDTVLL